MTPGCGFPPGGKFGHPSVPVSPEQSPRLTRHGLVFPDLRYLVNDCSLAHITCAELHFIPAVGC